MKVNDKQTTQWLKKKIKPTKKNILFVSILATLSTTLLIFQLYLIAYIADAGYLHQQSVNQLTQSFILIFILFTLRSLVIWYKEIKSFKTSATIRTTLRKEVLQKIESLGPTYSKKFSSGELITTANEQIEALHHYLIYYLPQIYIALLVPLTILAFIFPVSITSGLILIACAPLIPFFMILIGMGAQSVHQKHFQKLAQMSNHFLDTISGLSTLKLFNKSKLQEKRIYQTSEEYRITVMQVLRVAFLSSAVLEVFASLSIALLAVYLGMGFLNAGSNNHWWWSINDMSLTGALFILLLAPEFFLALRQLSTYYHAKAEAMGAATELKKLLDYDIDDVSVRKKNDQSQFNLATQTISFNHICFSYSNASALTLDDINFKIKPKSTVILIGPSGCGKSSLLSLLVTFITPSSGQIMIDGLNLGTVDSKLWHNQISWLGQMPKLFNGTILDNIKMAKKNATTDEINSLIKKVQLTDLINALPNGLNTQISEKLNLSSGQAQRIALARTLLKDSPIVLLDEPTQNLDKKTERLIMNMLLNDLKDKTVIIATHRLNYLEKVDQILTLNQGKLTKTNNLIELKSNTSTDLALLDIKKGLVDA